MKVNAYLIDFNFKELKSQPGHAEMVFEIRLRRKSNGIGEPLFLNLTMGEWSPEMMIRDLKKAMKALVERRDLDLKGAKARMQNFIEEATA